MIIMKKKISLKNDECKCNEFTVEPFGVVFEGPLEGVLAAAGRVVVEIRAEDDGIGFGELGVGARVERRQTPRIAVLHPNGRAVVARVERALGDAHSNTGHVLISTQLRQISLKNINKKFNLLIYYFFKIF